MAVALLATIVGGCGGTEESSPSPNPPPTSVRDADPCSFLPRSLATTHDLKQVQADDSETSRSCAWSSASFSMMILVRWDSDSLVDFAQAFPVLSEDDVDLGGVQVAVGKSDDRPACAALFFAERGTVVEIVVGDEPPSSADAACERVENIGASTIQEIRDQDLLDAAPTATPTTTP
jgi:hypothetical protein